MKKGISSESLILLTIAVFLSVSCSKSGGNNPTPPAVPTAPIVQTTSQSLVTRTTVQSGGSISSDGGASITAKGVCWSTTANPTVANSKTTDGAGLTSFTSSITGLTANTTYNIRAYATNSVGTAYGNEITFTTNNFSVPSITTNQTVDILTLFATNSGGVITDDGGMPVTGRGVCWGAGTNPTISGNKTIDGSGVGSFLSTITPLAANNTYYIRAYATNSIGTAYGDERIIVLDVEGNVYNSIKIGTQVWMMNNLRTTKLNNGTPIQNVTANSVWSNFSLPVVPAYCWFNNDISNKNPYGALYNWPIVNSGFLAPPGWHIPAATEFGTLIHFLDPLTSDTTILAFGVYPWINYRTQTAGGKLKEEGLSHWASPNSGATNESKFTAVGTGQRHEFGGGFGYKDSTCGFWTSTPIGFDNSARMWMVFSSPGLPFAVGPDGIRMGYCVRCIKD